MRTAAVLILSVALIAATASTADAARTHVVQPGENLYRIALRYGVTVEAIARANGIGDPTRLRVGQVLMIPESGPASRSVRAKAAGIPASPVALPAPALPLPRAVIVGRAYTVRRGDTLATIARRHGTTVAALKQANGLRSDRIYPGQALRIPGALPAPVLSAALVTKVVTQVLPLPEIGAEIPAPHPLRVRRGPKTYHTTLALVAADTPLRVLSEENGWYELQLPDGDIGWVYQDELRVVERREVVDPASVRGADIVREAMRYLGTPYVWGGESSRGVDCSGFVYIVLNSRLPQLARMRSFDYFQLGVPVDRADLLPGDLVFFTTYLPGPSHVGIYVGDGRFIQASSGARRVVITSLDDPYYAARYLGARRLLAP